jgi:hypothetical protein
MTGRFETAINPTAPLQAVLNEGQGSDQSLLIRQDQSQIKSMLTDSACCFDETTMETGSAA